MSKTAMVTLNFKQAVEIFYCWFEI